MSYAIDRTPGGNPTADALMRAEQQWRATGQVPHGYSVNPNGAGLHLTAGNDGGFLNKHGWELMAALAGGGTALGMALPAAGGGAAAGAIPSLGVTTGLPAGLFGAAPTVAGGAGAAGTAAATAAKGAGMAFGAKDAIGMLPAVLSMFGGHKTALPPQNAAMNDLIAMQTNRLKESDPLYQAILRMAMGLLPMSARGGMPAPTASPAQPGLPPGRRPF